MLHLGGTAPITGRERRIVVLVQLVAAGLLMTAGLLTSTPAPGPQYASGIGTAVATSVPR